jgi:NitT/TauT family transport system permease protein
VTSRLSNTLAGCLALAVILAAWEIVARALKVPTYFVPLPSAVGAELLIRGGYYAEQTWATLASVLIGFGVATVLGVLFGTITAYSRIFRTTVYPLILLLQTVPKVALAPLLILFLGYGLEFQVVLVASIAFFPIVINTVLGLTSVDADLLVLSRVLGTPRLREFWMVGLPHSAPSIFSGMKVAMTLSVIGAVVAEFVSSEKGLGHVLVTANSQFDTVMAFAALFVLSAMGLLLYGAIGLLQRWSLPWADEPALGGTYMP